MNERQFQHVIAAVETGGFTSAAERCGVAQASLSASIARLERDLGVPLFHRVGRRVLPTDACLAMLPAARDAVSAVERARRAAEMVHVGVTGHLALAVQPSVVMAVVPLVAALRREQPGIACSLRAPGDDGSVTSMVASGSCEVGVGDVQERAGLRWQVLHREPYVLVEPAGSAESAGSTGSARVRRRPPRRIGSLGDTAMVLPPEGSPTRSVIDAMFLDAGVAPRVVVEVDLREALLPLVAAGAGATILPESMVAAADRSKLLVTPLSSEVERSIGIVVRDAPLTPLAGRLLAVAAGG
ncbi:MAG: LysR family transcriptional regulator [Actinobacteria bacterium]|nr:LysR family transcriptional regulator [Actinomycetota bacterium]